MGELKIGQSMDVRIGLSTRTIERLDVDKYRIHDLTTGWQYADVNEEDLGKVLTGELSLLDLEFV